MRFESLTHGIPVEQRNPFRQETHPLQKEASRTETEFLKRGVFFDVYGLDLPGKDGKTDSYVIKDFRSGDQLSDPEEQVALFQHQYYEWNLMRHEVGGQFFPASQWIRGAQFSDDQAHGFYSEPGKTPNTMGQFIVTQIDRQLGNRYSSDDTQKGLFKRLMADVGKRMSRGHGDRPFIGAVIQERISGIPFAEAMKRFDLRDDASVRLQENVRQLIRGIRRFQSRNDAAAFTWHGLESDNVVAEVDEQGALTGSVFVLDANFTERPNELFRQKVHKRLEANVFSKLEEGLAL